MNTASVKWGKKYRCMCCNELKKTGRPFKFVPWFEHKASKTLTTCGICRKCANNLKKHGCLGINKYRKQYA